MGVAFILFLAPIAFAVYLEQSIIKLKRRVTALEVQGLDSKGRELLRHTVATLAYRARKALLGAPEGFATFQAGEGSRTPDELLAHMGDLFDWANSLVRGEHRWRDSAPLPWHEEIERFFDGLERFDAYLASDAPLGYSVERLFQGPVADALTHVGQIGMLRRLAGSPVRGENYFKAEITAGRVGMEQAAPRVELD
jgi:hypothetical protein